MKFVGGPVFGCFLFVCCVLSSQVSAQAGADGKYEFRYERLGKGVKETETISAQVVVNRRRLDKEDGTNGTQQWSCCLDRIEVSERIRKRVPVDVSSISLNFIVQLDKTGVVARVIVPVASEVGGQPDFCGFLVQQCVVMLFPDMHEFVPDPCETWDIDLPKSHVFTGESAEVFGRGLQGLNRVKCRKIDDIKLGAMVTARMILGESSDLLGAGSEMKLLVLWDDASKTVVKTSRVEVSPKTSQQMPRFANIFSLTKQY